MASQLDLSPERMQLLQKEYANKFIAMCEGEVIASDESYATVLARADEVCPDRNYLIRFIQSEDLYVLDFSNSA